ncbi:hypothetical protein BJ508DRAFT_324817 [Ascobolus immersus RN42]|uniref:BTB domain-containing protein n=1 Tax=Ascobolus immersus RN42 TaxID=1160509 RepID=A0A3N4IAW5_ASCIM|nr:hypothetical protein BJ508DRAFT_324817 [Ascobolus immersus RN42]
MRKRSRELLETGSYSNLLIRGQGSEFKVHQQIVCPQSCYFAACMASGMKESETRILDLMDENPDDIKLMLDFMYGGTYWEHSLDQPPGSVGIEPRSRQASDGFYFTNTKSRSQGTEARDISFLTDPLLSNIRTYNLADKRGIDGLTKEVLWKVLRYTEVLLTFVPEYGFGRVPIHSLLPANATCEEKLETVEWEWSRLIVAAEATYDIGCHQSERGRLVIGAIVDVVPIIRSYYPSRIKELKMRMLEIPELAVALFDALCTANERIIEEALEHV